MLVLLLTFAALRFSLEIFSSSRGGPIFSSSLPNPDRMEDHNGVTKYVEEIWFYNHLRKFNGIDWPFALTLTLDIGLQNVKLSS